MIVTLAVIGKLDAIDIESVKDKMLLQPHTLYLKSYDAMKGVYDMRRVVQRPELFLFPDATFLKLLLKNFS